MTRLIPVSEWQWDLWKVTYHTTPEGPAEPGYDRYLVSTDTHVQGEVCEGDRWPSPHLNYARWEPVAEKVRAPRAVGSYYGQTLYEDGWAAGEREAQERKLK